MQSNNNNNKLNNEIVLALMHKKHLEAVVNCHLESFQGFFLSFLGPKFLKLLYSEIINSVNGLGVVAIRGNELVGFAIGSMDTPGLFKRLVLRRVLRFALCSLLPLIKKPSIIGRLLGAFNAGQKSQEFSSKCSLMSIATSKKCQGQGIGKKILRGFFELARSKGALDVCLTTDAENNDSTNLFYRNNGFVLKRIFLTPEKRKMNEYYISFDSL